MEGRPIRIFHGTPDDYNPIATCKAYVARLQDARRDVVLTEYPDSQHGFDAGLLGLSTVAVSANAQTARNCHIKEGEGGVLGSGVVGCGCEAAPEDPQDGEVGRAGGDRAIGGRIRRDPGARNPLRQSRCAAHHREKGARDL
jgi:hypothetical protein